MLKPSGNVFMDKKIKVYRFLVLHNRLNFSQQRYVTVMQYRHIVSDTSITSKGHCLFFIDFADIFYWTSTLLLSEM